MMLLLLAQPYHIKIHTHKILTHTFAVTILVLLSVSSAICAQVTLAWDPVDPAPQGYKLLQRTTGGVYDYANPAWPMDRTHHTETRCTVTNLTPGVTYHFIVLAYIGDDQSGDSNEISYTVPAEKTLSSISINGPTQIKESSSTQYTCTAKYSDGSTEILTSGISWSENCPSTGISTGGLLTAFNVDADTSISVKANFNGRSDTVSVAVKNIPTTLSSIAINGPIQINANSSARYTCTAKYSDGSTAQLSSGITWRENSRVTQLSPAGMLTAGSVTSDTAATVTAIYRDKRDTHSLTVKKTPANLTRLSITGPSQVNEGASAQYTCTAHYSDNKIAIVSDSVHWYLNSNFASIDAAGKLIADSIPCDQQVTVTASYDGRHADQALIINNTIQNYTLTIDIQGSGSVLLNPHGGTYNDGTVVTLTAEADPAHVFDSWIGSVNDPDAATTTVTMDDDISLSATFLEDTDMDSVPDREEWGKDSQDTHYDGNGDGIADALQSNVVSIHSYDYAAMLTLSTPEPGRITACRIDDPEFVADAPTDCTLPLGLIALQLENIPPGGATTVTIDLPAESELDSFYQFGPTPDNPEDVWYDLAYDQVLGLGAVYEGQSVTLYLRDGQTGDNDLLENGVISNLGGPGTLSENDATAPNPQNPYQLGDSDTSNTNSGGSCFINSIVAQQ